MKSIGTLRYSPKNNGSLDRRNGGSTKWWLVMDADPDIGAYYRHMFYMFRHKVERISRPTWHSHISVIRNEKPLDDFVHLWEKYEGQQIEFDYDPTKAQGDNTYVWLPVVCEAALDLRVELGLSRDPFFALHLTIGNFKEMPK